MSSYMNAPLVNVKTVRKMVEIFVAFLEKLNSEFVVGFDEQL